MNKIRVLLFIATVFGQLVFAQDGPIAFSLEEAINNEDYEKAAKIRDELSRRN